MVRGRSMERRHIPTDEFLKIFDRQPGPAEGSFTLGLDEDVAHSFRGCGITEFRVIKQPSGESYEAVYGVGEIHSISLSFKPEDARAGIEMEDHHPVTLIVYTDMAKYKIKGRYSFSGAQGEKGFFYFPVVELPIPNPHKDALFASKRDGEEVVLRISANK